MNKISEIWDRTIGIEGIEQEVSGTHSSILNEYTIDVWENVSYQGGLPCLRGTRIPVSVVLELGIDEALKHEVYGKDVKKAIHITNPKGNNE